jgi:hypoxanthine phosphoribosyltransferase
LKKIENYSGIHSLLKSRTVELKFNYDLNGKKVLIVDDAVDSGNSLMNIINKLNESYPEILEIKSAVITVTKRNPVLFPDFYLFKDNSILTFPWTEDSPFNSEFKKLYKSYYES